MLCKKVSDVNVFVEPASNAWTGVSATDVDLIPTPLGMQPNDYIIAKWTDRKYGSLDRLSVSSLHDTKRIAFRMSWRDEKKDTGDGEDVPDGAALMFPVSGDPVLMTMGAENAPVHALHWRARKDEIRSVTVTGIGSSQRSGAVAQAVKSAWSQGVWTLVITRDLDGPEEVATFRPGQETRIGFAIWNGGNQERGGIKAVSPDWTAFALEA